MTNDIYSMADLQKDFEAFVAANKLFTKNDLLLVACSGGADSVVLCHLLHGGGYPFAIAHCNFQLRGEESNRDESFVRHLGEKYHVRVHIAHFDTAQYAENKKISIQVAARELRYGWFYSLLAAEKEEQTKPNLLLTAHHADDNIETVLMNFFKGTGIGGLHGILPKKERTVRPLLFAKKEALLQYARQEGLQWMEDSSNASDKYTRNFFRHQVVPLVEQAIPNAANNVLGNIGRLGEVEMIYNSAIAQHKKKLLEYKGNEIHIPVLKLAKTVPLHTIVYELLKDQGFLAAQIKDIVALLQSATGKYVASPTHRVIKNRNWLIVAPKASTEAGNILVEKEDKEVFFENGRLLLDAGPAGGHHISSGSEVALLDAKNIRFPLLLRKWKPGDYFYPLGMPKKKKIARFLIDQKISKTDKEKIWVLESDKKILWVAGQRIDDRFKITDATTATLRLSLQTG